MQPKTKGMFAIIIDIDTTEEQAEEILALMQRHSFAQQIGTFFMSESNELTTLLYAMNALKATPWFTASVRDIRAFRVENWSDFTQFMKE